MAPSDVHSTGAAIYDRLRGTGRGQLDDGRINAYCGAEATITAGLALLSDRAVLQIAWNRGMHGAEPAT